MHLFEVRKNGKTLQYTDDRKSIPTEKVLREIKNAGYKVYVNGKVWKDTKTTNEKGAVKNDE